MDKKPRYVGNIIAVNSWAGESHGSGKNICYDPHPNDEVTIWVKGHALSTAAGMFNPRALVDCYRHQVEEPQEPGPTLYENARRLAIFVER